MATILEFRVAEHSGVRNEAPTEETLGEIIIFPGVRIERHGTQDNAMPHTGGDTPAEARTTSRI